MRSGVTTCWGKSALDLVINAHSSTHSCATSHWQRKDVTAGNALTLKWEPQKYKHSELIHHGPNHDSSIQNFFLYLHTERKTKEVLNTHRKEPGRRVMEWSSMWRKSKPTLWACWTMCSNMCLTREQQQYTPRLHTGPAPLYLMLNTASHPFFYPNTQQLKDGKQHPIHKKPTSGAKDNIWSSYRILPTGLQYWWGMDPHI